MDVDSTNFETETELPHYGWGVPPESLKAFKAATVLKTTLQIINYQCADNIDYVKLIFDDYSLSNFRVISVSFGALFAISGPLSIILCNFSFVFGS